VARRIPAVASIELVDNRNLTATKPVDAGSATNSGHWYDAASLHNLNLAMCHAQPVHQQCWDDTFVLDSGAAYVDRYEITVPELSDQHLSLTCRVYGATTGVGLVKFTSLATGNTSIVTLPGAAAWTAGAAVLDMTLGFPVLDYDTITIATWDKVDIENIAIEWVELNPGGAYPAADDALAAGVGPGGVPPLDTLEVDADSPLCSEIAQTVSAGITSVGARVRNYVCFGSIDAAGFATPDPGVPFRFIVPMMSHAQSIHYRIKAAKGGSIRTHIIQHCSSGIGAAFENWQNGNAPSGFTAVEIAAGAGNVWDDDDVDVLDGSILPDAPGAYVGFAVFAIYPDAGLLSFTMWGV